MRNRKPRDVKTQMPFITSLISTRDFSCGLLAHDLSTFRSKWQNVCKHQHKLLKSQTYITNYVNILINMYYPVSTRLTSYNDTSTSYNDTSTISHSAVTKMLLSKPHNLVDAPDLSTRPLILLASFTLNGREFQVC